MKKSKLIALFMILILAFQPMGFSDYDETIEGTTNVSDLDTELTDNFTALEGMLDEIRGFKNLKVVRDSATQVTVTADILYLQSSANLAAQEASVSEAIAITTSGASGLDTGTEAVSTWYYIWIIRKSSDGTVNGLLSTSSTSPTMPTDYDQKTLVSVVRNNSSSDFVSFKQHGLNYWYTVWQSAASGAPGSASWTAVDITSYVPSSLSEVVLGSIGNASDSHNLAVTNDNSVATGSATAPNKLVATDNAVATTQPFEFNVLTANTIYWLSDTATGTLYVSGFRITKLG